MNPYYGYIISCAVTLGLYSLHWSDRYPSLTLPLASFLIATMLLHLVCGWLWQRKYRLPASFSFPPFNHVQITIFIYLLWTADFAYEGGVPLLKILLNQPYNYRLFGVPSLHVFTVTFSSFYTVYLFHIYITQRSRRILLLWLINLSAALLIYSRAMLFFNLFSCLMILLMDWKWWRPAVISGLLGGFLIMLFLFGVLGNLRVSREAARPYTNDLFLSVGKASTSFRQSIIPAEFFWSYVYVTSPMANLQSNVSQADKQNFSISGAGHMIINEFLFDFISKRVNRWTGHVRATVHTIGDPFNVSTAYAASFSYLNWTGVIMMALFILVLPMLYVKMMHRSSSYYVTGLSILCTIFFFLLYDNTIRFTGLGFQLVYPLLLGWAERKFNQRETVSQRM